MFCIFHMCGGLYSYHKLCLSYLRIHIFICIFIGLAFKKNALLNQKTVNTLSRFIMMSFGQFSNLLVQFHGYVKKTVLFSYNESWRIK